MMKEFPKTWCADGDCSCHTKPENAVLTPFPLGLGPEHCCSACARMRIDGFDYHIGATFRSESFVPVQGYGVF